MKYWEDQKVLYPKWYARRMHFLKLLGGSMYRPSLWRRVLSKITGIFR